MRLSAKCGQGKTGQVMAEDCREKIMSDEYVDFIWKSDYNVRELERLYPQYCVQILNDFLCCLLCGVTDSGAEPASLQL